MTPFDEGLRVKAWRTLSQSFLRTQEQLTGTLRRGSPVALVTLEILLVIEDEGGVVGQRALLDSLGMSQSWVSRLLARMDDEGLIVRERFETNRRSARISITPAGTAALAQGVPTYLAGIRGAFRGFKRAELTELTMLLDRVGADDSVELDEPVLRTEVVALGEALVSHNDDAVVAADAQALRDVLEPLVAQEAARYRTTEGVGRLRSLVLELSRNLGRPREFLAADWRLHRTMAGFVRNELLRSVYLALLDMLEERFEAIVDEDDDLQGHLARRLVIQADLVESIADGDPARASQVAERHRLGTRGAQATPLG